MVRRIQSLLACALLLSGAGGAVADPAEVEGAMESRCSREVQELHQFFQDWFTAALPDEDSSFARFSNVVADGFAIITPEGRTLERDLLLTGLRGAHGSWADGGRIWIENLNVRRTVGDLALVTYEEWQESEGQTRGRLSTALFRESAVTPNGVEWLHVHETWLPPR